MNYGLEALDQYSGVRIRQEEEKTQLLELKQATIDAITKELIDIHTQDIDDMLAYLISEHPEKAHELLKNMLNPGHTDIRELTIQRHWFLREFIPEQCAKLAEKELEE